MHKTPLVILLALTCCASLVFAQLPDETSGRVPELDAFHKPIYELWHNAWPAKDIAKLKSLLADVESAYAKLAAAKLPGILRDKSGKWSEKRQLLDHKPPPRAGLALKRPPIEQKQDNGQAHEHRFSSTPRNPGTRRRRVRSDCQGDSPYAG
jgi:hypothetical protein